MVEREYEQYKTVVLQETQNAFFLSPRDIDMMKGPTNAEEVLCDSDEFELEGSCGDGRGKDGNYNRDRGESRDDAPTLANNNSCNVSNISQTLDDKFLKKLDTLGLDLSMDIADLSALIDDSDYVKDAARYQQSENEI